MKLANSIIVLPILMMLVIFMEFLDMTIVNTAIPSIARSFSVHPLSIKFAVVSYFVGVGIFLPISGWCVDKFGYKVVFFFAVFLFAASSWFCAISHNVQELTIFRFLQGVGGAFMNPVARIMIVRQYPQEKLVKIQGVIFTPAILGIVLGPFLGGLLSQYLGWEYIFYINIPFSLVALVLGGIYIGKNNVAITEPLDIKGFVLSTIGLTGVIVFIESINHYELFSKQIVFAFGSIGIIAFYLLYQHCQKKVNAIFNLELLKINTIYFSFLINICIYTLNSGVVFLLPLMYQEDFNFSPYKSGVLIVPISVGYFLSRIFSNKIIHKFGFKKVIFYATGGVLLSILFISLITATTPLLLIIFFEFFLGASFVCATSSTSALIYLNMHKKQASEVTTLDLTLKHFSTSLGVGISSFILMSLGEILGQNEFSPRVFHYTYIIIAILPLIASAISSRIKIPRL